MIYFDNAATGFPKSKSVISATEKAMYISGNSGRSGHIYSIRASEILYSVREIIADIFGTSSERIILCPSATYALNIGIKGLKKRNSKVLISDLEHNSVIRPSSSEETALFFEVDINDDKKTIDNFKNVLFSNSTNKISLVVITHASNVCGRILPVNEISYICREKNIPIILDASQTAGYIPINFSETPVDVICIPGHKGFYGPMGTGALIINPESNLEFKTIIEGGTGIHSQDIYMPNELPERLEAGTMGVHDFAGFHRAIKECSYVINGMKEKYEYIINELKKNDKILLYGISYENLDKYMPIILFNALNISSQSFAQKLFEKGFCVRSGFHCAPTAHEKLGTGQQGAIRISIGKNNTFMECRKLIEAISEISKKNI